MESKNAIIQNLNQTHPIQILVPAVWFKNLPIIKRFNIENIIFKSAMQIEFVMSHFLLTTVLDEVLDDFQ
jgi:hypothetical protein